MAMRMKKDKSRHYLIKEFEFDYHEFEIANFDIEEIDNNSTGIK